MKWETVLNSETLTIDMGILPSTNEYIVRVFLDRKEPLPHTWKPIYGRVIQKSFDKDSVPLILKTLIDAIPEHKYAIH